MKLVLKFAFFLLLFTSCTNYAQIHNLYNKNTLLRNMNERWELDTTNVMGTFLITSYKPIYILLGKYSSNPNEQPHSENNNPEYITSWRINYDNIELKFQLSFKTKVLQNFFWGKADLWVANTQKSFWQIYNNDLSRPFREINYEPEVISIFL